MLIKVGAIPGKFSVVPASAGAAHQTLRAYPGSGKLCTPEEHAQPNKK
jgi:hypothetical protein